MKYYIKDRLKTLLKVAGAFLMAEGWWYGRCFATEGGRFSPRHLQVRVGKGPSLKRPRSGNAEI